MHFYNAALTQRGITTLARTTESRGLPKLESFYVNNLGKVTARGIDAIAHAVIKGCPQLCKILLAGSGPDDDSHHDAVRSMFEAAGRDVDVIYEADDDDSDDEEEGEEEEEDGDD